MISPLMKRRRLGAEMLRARKNAKLSTTNAFTKAGMNTASLSRLENGTSTPNTAEVMALLNVYGVTGDEWHRLVALASEAAEPGWWKSFGRHMGSRQQVTADLEAGANAIREYAGGFVPGLLQTAEYTRARWEVGQLRGDFGPTAKVDKSIDARLARQKMMRRPDGPAYTAVIDELALRRHAAPIEVMKNQIFYLADLKEDSQIEVLVLPIVAPISDYWVPNASFSLYTYPDPEDPDMAMIEGEANDQLLSADATAPYAELFRRLQEASLSPADSTRLLHDVAAAL